MADFAKYLPLSQRPKIDGTGVTAHGDAAIGGILVGIAGMLDELTAEQWESPSLCEGWRVRDVAGHLVWRVGSSTGQMLSTGLRAYVGKHINPMRAMDELSARAAEASYATLVAELRHIAALKLSGSGRHGLGIDGTVTGAVARGRTLILPLEKKEVLRRRTLVATDADWRVGRGPEIQGRADAIVLFLFGRAPLPAASAG
jgi:Mycothiol maleylpyruvate isomerase N-terminal domain.